MTQIVDDGWPVSRTHRIEICAHKVKIFLRPTIWTGLRDHQDRNGHSIVRAVIRDDGYLISAKRAHGKLYSRKRNSCVLQLFFQRERARHIGDACCMSETVFVRLQGVHDHPLPVMSLTGKGITILVCVDTALFRRSIRHGVHSHRVQRALRF